MLTFEGSDGNSIIQPYTALVSSLRDTITKPCYYNETHQDCAPTGQYDFGFHKIIDFKFGIAPTQVAQVMKFYYAIIGSWG